MPAPKKYKAPGSSSLIEQPSKPGALEILHPLPLGLTMKGQSKRALKTSSETATQEPPPKYTKEQLKDNWNKLTHRAMKWVLDGDRLEGMLAESKLKDIAVVLGISTEKVLLMEGQPTQIIAQPQQAQLDKLGQALQVALQQRGITKTVTVTERTAKIDIKNEPQSTQ